MSSPALSITGVSKSFDGSQVLHDVSLSIDRGEVHALLGHNGSGKSTLIKILAGVYTPDGSTAEIRIGGRPLPATSPADAYRLGLRFVHQNIAVVNEMGAADNLALGDRFQRRFGPVIDWPAQREAARRTLQTFNAADRTDPEMPLGSAAALTRARFAIARAMRDLHDGGILVLDEPTAALAATEIEDLFASIRELAASGASVLYVTHKLSEVYAIADNLTVLRDGHVITNDRVANVPMGQLVDLLAGDADDEHREAGTAVSPSSADSASGVSRERFLEVENLESSSIAKFSARFRGGEITAVCGLDGSGRERLARALCGADPARVDAISTARGRSDVLDIRTSRSLGIALASESRAPGALVDQFTIRENIALATQKRIDPLRIRRHKEYSLAQYWIRRLDVKPPTPDAVLATMSGGNRQKVVIAKTLVLEPDVWILDEPTAGVDVGAAAALHRIFREFAEAGGVVILVSSDLDEICALASRALVMVDGKIADDIDGEAINERTLLTIMAGGRVVARTSGSADSVALS